MQPAPSSSTHATRRSVPRQHVRLGIHRSDYMLHGPSLEEVGYGCHEFQTYMALGKRKHVRPTSSVSATPHPTQQASIRQVEVNTIASSFASLSTRTTQLHKYLTEKVLASPSSSASSSVLPLLPANEALDGLAHGLAMAHEEYLRQERALWRSDAYYSSRTPKARPCVLMIVQPGERNVIDQKLLEVMLWERYRVPLVRASLKEVAMGGRLDLGGRQNLLLKLAKRRDSTGVDGGAGAEAVAPTVWKQEEEGEEVEVTVAYFRAGYTPSDYSGEAEWKGREMLEMSAAIKCPCVAYHLAGTKKVQEALSRPGQLERFLPDPAEAALVRASFAALYGLDPGRAETEAAVREALARPEEFVLKPQREGGGNNMYGAEMVASLRRMSEEERAAFILMGLIRPPLVESLLVREGAVERLPCLYELGIYGVYLGDSSQTGKTLLNVSCGHLLRTKPATSDEGGVAAGFAVLSSPLLVAPAPTAPLTRAEEARLLRYCKSTTQRVSEGRRRRQLQAVGAAVGMGVLVAAWLATTGRLRARR